METGSAQNSKGGHQFMHMPLSNEITQSVCSNTQFNVNQFETRQDDNNSKNFLSKNSENQAYSHITNSKIMQQKTQRTSVEKKQPLSQRDELIAESSSGGIA